MQISSLIGQNKIQYSLHNGSRTVYGITIWFFNIGRIDFSIWDERGRYLDPFDRKCQFKNLCNWRFVQNNITIRLSGYVYGKYN